MKLIIPVLLIAAVLFISGCAQQTPVTVADLPDRVQPQNLPTGQLSVPAPPGQSSSGTESTKSSDPIEAPDKICPAVCVQMWTLENNNCVFTPCGSGCGPDNQKTFETENECKSNLGTSSQTKAELPNFLKAAHFVDSFPKHGDALTQTPKEVVINFNFVIKVPTSAKVLRNGVEIPTEMQITDEEYALRVNLKGEKGDGIYTVELNACWPDKSCHEGRLAFTVDSAKKAAYKDFAGKTEVTVHMKDILFDVPIIVIDKGTKVTWINDDDVEHFINTDPHPTHNSLEPFNSKTLKKGDIYSYTFTETGEFGYHCSAHADLMTGKILVV